MKIEQRYLDGSYLNHNPSWDREDSPWKANLVTNILKNHNINPKSVCEVGCGSGDILRCLRQSFPNARLVGYDISPQASQFWTQDTNNTNVTRGGGNNNVYFG